LVKENFVNRPYSLKAPNHLHVLGGLHFVYVINRSTFASGMGGDHIYILQTLLLISKMFAIFTPVSSTNASKALPTRIQSHIFIISY